MSKVAEISFIRFVYPFSFNPDEFEKRVEALDSAKWPGRGSNELKIWEAAKFPDEELMPYLADYLNPQGNKPATARLWRMSPNTLRSLHGLGGGLENPGAKWSLVVKDASISFSFGEIQFVLFGVGIGFITFFVGPQSEHLSEWLDFLHYFRFTARPKSVRVKASYEKERGVREPFMPPHITLAGRYPDNDVVFNDILKMLLMTGDYRSEAAKWWQDVFIPKQMLPFAVLYIDNFPSDEIPNMLYRVRNFFHSKQELRPSPEDLRSDQPALLPYAKDMWFLFSLDGGAFVGCNVPRNNQFFRQTLADHLANHYFLVYLLTLHQRFTLTSLLHKEAEAVSVGKSTVGNDHYVHQLEAFERIRKTLFMFTGRGMFSQIMQREHHHRYYRRWQEIFQIDHIYQELNNELQEMHSDILLRAQAEQREQIERIAREERERDRHLGRWVQGLALIFGFPALILAAFDAIGNIPWTIVFWSGIGAMIIGLVTWSAIQFFAKRS